MSHEASSALLLQVSTEGPWWLFERLTDLEASQYLTVKLLGGLGSARVSVIRSPDFTTPLKTLFQQWTGLPKFVLQKPHVRGDLLGFLAALTGSLSAKTFPPSHINSCNPLGCLHSPQTTCYPGQLCHIPLSNSHRPQTSDTHQQSGYHILPLGTLKALETQEKSHWTALESLPQACLSLWMVISLHLDDNLKSTSCNNQIPLVSESYTCYLCNAFWITSLLKCLWWPCVSGFHHFSPRPCQSRPTSLHSSASFL